MIGEGGLLGCSEEQSGLYCLKRVFLYHEDYSVNELSFGDACLLLEAAAEI